MHDHGTKLILTLFLGAGLAAGCGNNSDSTSNVGNTAGMVQAPDNTNAAKSNVEELEMLVNVPYETEDIVWKTDVANKRVLAVLRFSSADSDKVVSEAEKFGAPSSVSIAAETWFPSELIAQSEVSGDSMLKGLAYPANTFYLEPYASGRVTRIEGSDYFVLELVAR